MRTLIRQALITRMIGCLFLFALSLSQGCAKSPDELLIGRWYSSDMTIRFRPDSGVIWNSRAGLAVGRYEFSSGHLVSHNTQPTPNLLLDVIRKEERSKFQFEAKLLGADRLQLKFVPILSPGETADPAATQAIVLRRSNDDQLGGKTVVQR